VIVLNNLLFLLLGVVTLVLLAWELTRVIRTFHRIRKDRATKR
jgi:uncharacterized membrane protein